MTLHIDYNHNCPKCQALYIPYDKEVPCPKCGGIEEERFDFITKAADSARYNMKDGSYMPGAWWVGSYGDHVLFVVFQMLEKHRIGGQGKSFEAIARIIVDNTQWGDQLYAKEHFFQIACQVHEEIVKRPPLPPPEATEWQEPVRTRKKWWQFWK